MGSPMMTTPAPTTFAPTTFAPTTFAPTTFSPTPTTMPPTTFAPTTFAPPPTTMAPGTTPAPTAAPAPMMVSPSDMVAVQVCIAGSSATVSLEGGTPMVAAWNGMSFPAVSFAPFMTANNSYPAYMVSGQLNGNMLDITIVGGGDTTTFSIPATGDALACPPA